MYVGATSYRHQNWTSHKENRGDGIRRRFQNFCDVTNRHLNCMAPPTDLRKGNGCSFEHPKTQSHGCRLIIQCNLEITLLDLRITSTVTSSGNVTCSWTIGKVKPWRQTLRVGNYFSNNEYSMNIPFILQDMT